MKATMPKPAAMMNRLGGHLAISMGIALAIAGATSLPHWLGARMGDAGRIAPVALQAVEPDATDGKFIDRLSLAAGEDRIAERPFTPATLAMPMAVSWPEPVVASMQTASVQAAPSTKLRSAAAEAVPLPPRRDPSLDERRMASAAAPLPILPVVEAPRPGEKREEGGWTRVVTTPVIKVAEVVSGTAGMAQAAGSWTLSQASGLLPRW